MRRRSAPTEPPPIADLAALALIDSALGTASRRGAFEHDEAERLVRDVASCIHEPVDAAVAAVVVDGAVASFGDESLVDRTRVVDALLDIRSLFQRQASSPALPVSTDPESTAALAR